MYCNARFREKEWYCLCDQVDRYLGLFVWSFGDGLVSVVKDVDIDIDVMSVVRYFLFKPCLAFK